MDHQRHRIREAVVAALLAGGTSAGSNVDEDPYDLVDPNDCPHLSVEDESEAQSMATIHDALERRYRFIVSASIVQNANAQRERDQLLADVEAILAAASLPGVISLQPLSYQPTSIDRNERRIRIGHQLFEAVYMTPQGDPSTAL